MTIHEITIQPVLNGFRVRVGCQDLVFNSREQMLGELGAYLCNPCEVEKSYREKALHKHLLNQNPAIPAIPAAQAEVAQMPRY